MNATGRKRLLLRLQCFSQLRFAGLILTMANDKGIAVPLRAGKKMAPQRCISILTYAISRTVVTYMVMFAVY